MAALCYDCGRRGRENDRLTRRVAELENLVAEYERQLTESIPQTPRDDVLIDNLMGWYKLKAREAEVFVAIASVAHVVSAERIVATLQPRNGRSTDRDPHRLRSSKRDPKPNAENLVTVYVSRIRDRMPGTIETVHGYGYRITEKGREIYKDMRRWVREAAE